MKKSNIAIVTGTVATIIGGLFLNWYTNNNIADKIILLSTKIGNVFTYPIPVWVVVLLFIVLGLLIKLLFIIVKPPYYEYREDKIYGLYWEWEWTHKDVGWDIINLRACCPKDKTQMTHQGRCPLCNFYYPAPDASLLEKVEIIIKRRAKLKEYLNKQ